VSQIEETYSLNLPKASGEYGMRTSAWGGSKGIAFKVPEAEAIRVTAIWRLTGDVRRSCDPDGSHCVAGGADLGLTFLMHHQLGETSEVLVSEQHTLLYANPMLWCAPGTEPWSLPLYDIIQPFVGCFGSFATDGFDNQVQAFNKKLVGQSVVIDLREYPGWISAEARIAAAVSGTSMTNIPSVHMPFAEFVGFRLEEA
jgi:hypothetical protein